MRRNGTENPFNEGEHYACWRSPVTGCIMSAPQDVLGEHPDIRRPTRDTRKTAMAPLHFKADRVGVIVMGVVCADVTQSVSLWPLS